MSPESKLWDTAKILVRKLGEDAPRYARERAYDWRRGGDLEASEIWNRILRMTQGMLTKEQPETTRWRKRPSSAAD
jgi:hypothetical protein